MMHARGHEHGACDGGSLHMDGCQYISRPELRVTRGSRRHTSVSRDRLETRVAARRLADTSRPLLTAHDVWVWRLPCGLPGRARGKPSERDEPPCVPAAANGQSVRAETRECDGVGTMDTTGSAWGPVQVATRVAELLERWLPHATAN
jgi:hypothetical protein